MKNFFEEYGITLLVGLAGLVVITMVISTLNNGDLVSSVFVTSENSTEIGLGNQEVANDETIKNKKLKPTLKTHDIVVEFGSTFDYKNYVGNTCTQDCFEAYVDDNGNIIDISNYVVGVPVDEEQINTSVSGQHQMDFIVKWNNEFVKSRVNIYVKEDPNAPDLEDPNIMDNLVRGVLKDVDGEGVEAHLQLSATGEDGTALVFNAYSGPTGSFIIYGVKPGFTYELYVAGYEGTPISTFLYEGGAYNLGLVGVS